MVIVDIYGTQKKVVSIPHTQAYTKWCELLPEGELQKIEEALKEKIDTNEVHTSSWIPGKNWEGTPYQAIYDALKNQEESAMFFGIILWTVMQKHPKKWAYKKAEVSLGSNIKGKIYFRLNP